MPDVVQRQRLLAKQSKCHFAIDDISAHHLYGDGNAGLDFVALIDVSHATRGNVVLNLKYPVQGRPWSKAHGRFPADFNILSVAQPKADSRQPSDQDRGLAASVRLLAGLLRNSS